MENHSERGNLLQMPLNPKPTPAEVRAYAEAVAVDFSEAAIFRSAKLRADLERAGSGGLR